MSFPGSAGVGAGGPRDDGLRLLERPPSARRLHIARAVASPRRRRPHAPRRPTRHLHPITRRPPQTKPNPNPTQNRAHEPRFGTEDNPIVVPSLLAERIIGVTDPDDDTLVIWGIVREGEPPKQLVAGGEFFSLRRVERIDKVSDKLGLVDPNLVEGK